MADWRIFGATNDERTCLWCGNRLRVQKDTSAEREIIRSAYDSNEEYDKARKASMAEAPILGYGDYKDGFFCALRCAYQFAVRMAQLGRRFKSTKEEKS